jgi:hypothetical protein
VVLRCTRKVLDLLGERARTLTDVPPSDDDWYLNLLWLDRRKCLLITHAGTLFSVLVTGVRKSDLRQVGSFVVDALELELRSEDLPTDALGHLDPAALQLAETASRSTLGFMNEMAVHIRYEVAAAGGLNNCDVDALNQHLRRTLHNRGGYVYPIDLVTQRLAGHPRAAHHYER